MIDKLKKFKINFILALGITVIFIIAEQFFRVYNEILSFNLTFKSFFEQFLIHFLIISIVSKRAIYIVYSLFLTFVWFQLVHFNYYGTWIFPLEYLLFFVEFKETLFTFKSVAYIAILPTLVTFFLAVTTFFILKTLLSKRVKVPYLSLVIILILLFTPVKIYLKNNYTKYSNPNFEYFIVKNTILTLSNLFGNVVPKKLSGKSGLEQEVVPAPIVIDKFPNVNVVLIMGESLTRDYMSLYDFEIDTTPFLDKLKMDEDFLYKKGVSSGVLTAISVPNFMHMIKKPDGVPQILSASSCLFRLAKKNGFNTYFFSAQAQDELKGIKSYLCTNWLDDLQDGTLITKIKDKSALDIYLLDMMDGVDFSKPVFLTLQQRASHTPFVETFPKEFEIYTKENLRDEDILQNTVDYFNSIRYTDFVLESIIKRLKKTTDRPTYIVFTSDHGTNIGDKNRQGHGLLVNESIYKVPFFIYSINTKNRYRDKFGEFPYISHFQISHLISSLLGYDTHYEVFNTKEDYYVCGNDLSGLGGFIKISFDENNILINKSGI